MVAEYKVAMHCNACERVVAKAISKMKGFFTSLPLSLSLSVGRQFLEHFENCWYGHNRCGEVHDRHDESQSGYYGKD